jgi:hypothetical protein
VPEQIDTSSTAGLSVLLVFEVMAEFDWVRMHLRTHPQARWSKTNAWPVADQRPNTGELELPSLSRRSLRDAGVEIIERRQPSLLFDDSVLITGESSGPPTSSTASHSTRCLPTGPG